LRAWVDLELPPESSSSESSSSEPSLSKSLDESSTSPSSKGFFGMPDRLSWSQTCDVDELAAREALSEDDFLATPVSLRVTRAVASVAQRSAETSPVTGTAAKAKSSSASAATSTRS
jgi:hypothetical protein